LDIWESIFIYHNTYKLNLFSGPKDKDLIMIMQNEINEFIRMIGCSRYVTAYLHIYDRNNYTVYNRIQGLEELKEACSVCDYLKEDHEILIEHVGM
jgi:hypothetical protein